MTFCSEISAGAGWPGNMYLTNVSRELKGICRLLTADQTGYHLAMIYPLVSLWPWQPGDSVGTFLWPVKYPLLRKTPNEVNFSSCPMAYSYIVKDEEEFSALIKSLDRMRHSRRKEPDISRIQIINIRLPCLVHKSHTNTAIENITPLPGLVPMKLSVSVWGEPHIHTCHLSRGWKIISVLLPSEARLIKA